jgi:hypothetical protein
MMMLTERDMRLMKALDWYGLLTTKQIQEICFTKAATRTMLRRLRALKKGKLIAQHTGLPRGQLVWTLSIAGLKRLASDTSITINKNSLEHDVQVSQVRLALDRAGLGQRWRSAYVLRAQSNEGVSPSTRTTDQIPDALCTARTKGGAANIALEVELVAKSKRRYRKIVEQYAERRDIDYVFYVVANPRIGTLILEMADKYTDSVSCNKFAYASIEDVLKLPQAAAAHFIDRKVRLDALWTFRRSADQQTSQSPPPTLKPTVSAGPQGPTQLTTSLNSLKGL